MIMIRNKGLILMMIAVIASVVVASEFIYFPIKIYKHVDLSASSFVFVDSHISGKASNNLLRL